MVKYKEQKEAFVIRQEEIAKDVFSLWVKTGQDENTKPGQFFMLYSKDGAHLLGRPISLCDFDKDDLAYRFVYQKKGFGTSSFSTLSSGNTIKIMGPLGNGFPVESNTSHVLLIGGGMGIAPILGMAKAYKEKAIVVLGYRDIPFMTEEFIDAGCRVVIATESGMRGIKGTVIDALKKEKVESVTAYACGPIPMLKAVVGYTGERNIKTYISLEEKMACGIGACLGCVVPATKANDHYNVNKLCICKDGPVFDSSEVIL